MQGSDRFQRREFVHVFGAGSVGLTAMLAGCTTGVDNGPDPLVVTAEPERDLAEVRGGEEIAVEVLVHNVGDAGSVTVFVETLADEHGVVDEESAEFDMEGESQESFTITMTVSASAEQLDAYAEPAAD